MSDTLPAPGLYPSPITPKSLAAGLRLSDVAWDSDGETLVWMEGRGDRGVLVASKLDGNAPRDLTDELSVRARVGYGGGDFTVANGDVYFAANSQIYRQNLKIGTAYALTPVLGQPASPVLSPDGKWVLYVWSHTRRDGLAVVDVDGKIWPRKVAEGRDFYMQPRFSPDGRWAAWVAWDHPNMPWDGTELYVAEVEQTSLGPVFKNPRVIAGDVGKWTIADPKSTGASVFQPEFSPDGKFLAFLADGTDPLRDSRGKKDEWYNFYLYELGSQRTSKLTNEEGVQLAAPAWAQGMRTYGWSHDSKNLISLRNAGGISKLVSFDVPGGARHEISATNEYMDFVNPSPNPKRASVAVIASSSVQSLRVIVADTKTAQAARVLKRATSESVEADRLIAPRAVNWKGTDGETVYGLLFQPPKNTDVLPPAILRIHGGPTGQTKAAYSGEVQFLVTRGYVVLDVNYRGSTGYGRTYMEALRGNWGVHDVNDSISGAKFLVDQKIADPSRLVIMGGSAGGFTVLQTLVDHPKFFKAGICLFGVSNQFTLAAETHKFEERYTDSLIGPLPQASNLYYQRSPQFHADKITDPLAVYQGEIDEVVPRNQSDTVVESLRRRNVPHVYEVYLGEGHGWRKSETIETFYKSVESFLKQYVLFA